MNLAKNMTEGTNGGAAAGPVPARGGRLGGADRAASPVPARAGRLAVAPRRDFVAVAELAVGHGPIGEIAAAPDGRALVVTNQGDDTISVIDPYDLAERATVYLPGEPVAAAVTGSRAYVATTSASYDAVSVIDTDIGTVLATCRLDLGVTAICGDAERVVAGRSGAGVTDLALVDLSTEAVSTVDLATVPGVVVDALRVGPDGSRLYVGLSDADRGQVLVMSDFHVLARVAIESPIRDIALSPDGDIAYVLVCGSRGSSLKVIDTRPHRVVRSVEIGGWPTQMALNPEADHVYVVDRDDVLVVSTATYRVVDVLTVGAQPSCVAAGPGRLYVADYAGSVTAAATSVPLVVEMPTVPTIRELQLAV